MFFNEMQLKVYYEMKKEEMEKAILADQFSKNRKKVKVYRRLFNWAEKPNCCNANMQKVCC